MSVGVPARRPIGHAGTLTGKLPGRRIGLLLLALILSTVAGYVGYQRFLAAAQTLPAVQTTPARTGSLVSTVSATGSVVEARQAKLGFPGSGKLTDLSVNVGDTVKAGQVLARLDTQALEIKVAQAESDLRTSQTKLQQLKDGATPEDIAAAQAAYDAATAKYSDLTAGPTASDRQAAQTALDQANANLATSQAKLDQLKAGPAEADVVAAQTAVDQAKANLASAQAKLDSVKVGPAQADWVSAQSAVDSATTNLKSAQAKLAQLKAGPTQADVSAAQAAVDQAKAALVSAEDKYQMVQNGNLQQAGGTSNSAVQQEYNSAKSNYDSAVQKLRQLQAGPLASDLQAAQSAVDSAQADYNSAVAKLNDMKKGPLPTDVASAQSAVDSAKAALASTQAKLDQTMAGATNADLVSAQSDVDSANSAVASAQAKLNLLLAGPTATDAQAALSGIASAKADLASKANPPKVTDLALAQEAVTQSELSLKQAQLDFQNATLTAPFDGVVAAVTPNVGELVSSGPMITLIDPKSARIDATVDESDVAKIALSQAATVTFDALPGTTLKGKVIAVAPSGTSTQGVVSYLVSVGVDSPPKLLPAGMSATLTIETSRLDNVLLVPNRAVHTQGSNHTVQVLAGDTGDRPETRQVQIGSSNDQFTQVVSGLQPGDRVVIPATSTTQPRGNFGPGVPGVGGAVIRAPGR